MLSMSFMQTKSALAAKEKLEKTRAEDSERLSKQTRQKEEQLAKLIQDKETKHSRLILLLFLVVCFSVFPFFFLFFFFNISLHSSSLLLFHNPSLS